MLKTTHVKLLIINKDSLEQGIQIVIVLHKEIGYDYTKHVWKCHYIISTHKFT